MQYFIGVLIIAAGVGIYVLHNEGRPKQPTSGWLGEIMSSSARFRVPVVALAAAGGLLYYFLYYYSGDIPGSETWNSTLKPLFYQYWWALLAAPIGYYIWKRERGLLRFAAGIGLIFLAIVCGQSLVSNGTWLPQNCPAELAVQTKETSGDFDGSAFSLDSKCVRVLDFELVRLKQLQAGKGTFYPQIDRRITNPDTVNDLQEDELFTVSPVYWVYGRPKMKILPDPEGFAKAGVENIQLKAYNRDVT